MANFCCADRLPPSPVIFILNQDQEKQIQKITHEWFAFEKFYGTSEERQLIDLIHTIIDDINNDYKNVYLVRNERNSLVPSNSTILPFISTSNLFKNEIAMANFCCADRLPPSPVIFISNPPK
jgi:hypothetical protein